MTSAGVVTTIAGNGTAGFADGAVSASMLNGPTLVTVDPVTEAIYVVDSGNARIRVIVNGTITTVAGTGTTGYVDGASPRSSAVLSAMAMASPWICRGICISRTREAPARLTFASSPPCSRHRRRRPALRLRALLLRCRLLARHHRARHRQARRLARHRRRRLRPRRRPRGRHLPARRLPARRFRLTLRDHQRRRRQPVPYTRCLPAYS